MHAFIFQAIVAVLGSREVPVDMVLRYASAIEHVVDTERLPFAGRRAKERSAVLLLALAYQESSLIEDIEMCRWRDRRGMDQDKGRSVGLTQLYEGYSRRGHARDEICGNAELQFRLALRYLTEQVGRCRDVERALTSYNANQCSASIYASRVLRTARRLERVLGIERDARRVDERQDHAAPVEAHDG